MVEGRAKITRKDEVKSTVEQASFSDHPQLVWEWGYSGTPLFQTPWIADFAINIQPNMHGPKPPSDLDPPVLPDPEQYKIHPITQMLVAFITLVCYC